MYVWVEQLLVPSLFAHGFSPTILFRGVNHLGLVTTKNAQQESAWKDIIAS